MCILNAGMTGFWGVPVANEIAKSADLIFAAGTRFGETNSSSWDDHFTFAIPPTRLIHLDIDINEIGRNYPTELGVVSDVKSGFAKILIEVKKILPKPRHNPVLQKKIKAGQLSFTNRWTEQRISPQFPLKPEPHSGRSSHSLARRRFDCDRRWLEQKWGGATVPHYHPGNLHYTGRSGNYGLRPGRGARRQASCP